jgi:DNA ligase (NAD+)
MVSRRNDVIPYVESLVFTPNPSHHFKSIHPTECPDCQSTLEFEGEYLVCKNGMACPSQVSGGIKRWVKKVGILEWGESVIEALVEDGLINDPADLYRLDEATLSAVELSGRRVGSGSKTMLANLHAKKDLPLNVIVGSLGIPLMGRSMVKKIVDAGYDTFETMAKAGVDELAAIPNMGRTKAEAFVGGLDVGMVSKLLMVGITIKSPSSGPLKGMSVCMTGFRNAEMMTAIEEAGGTVKSSVSKTLNYLVAKDPTSQSGKAKKARTQGTQVIGIDEMWNILS